MFKALPSTWQGDPGAAMEQQTSAEAAENAIKYVASLLRVGFPIQCSVFDIQSF